MRLLDSCVTCDNYYVYIYKYECVCKMMLECLTFMSQTTLRIVDLFYNFFTGLSGVMFAGKVTLLFLLIVLIRITVPRLRLETLSRSS